MRMRARMHRRHVQLVPVRPPRLQNRRSALFCLQSSFRREVFRIRELGAGRVEGTSVLIVRFRKRRLLVPANSGSLGRTRTANSTSPPRPGLAFLCFPQEQRPPPSLWGHSGKWPLGQVSSCCWSNWLGGERRRSSCSMS